MKRAYSLLTIKAVDEDRRIITGIATTPTPDRAGDIVEPKGAEFKLPIPLLWQHNSSQPIGHVTKAKVTGAGIEVQAQLAKIAEPGALRDRLDEAWQSIKSGLVKGLSIGFKEIEAARIADTYSFRFMKWLWLELSAVTIPANGEATIQTIKSADSELLAASGRAQSESGRGDRRPGVSGTTKSVKLGKATDMTTKTISEQLAALESSRGAKQTRMEEIMTKAADDGRSMTTDEQEEFDTLAGDVEALDGDIKRARTLERIKAQRAKPATYERPAAGEGGEGDEPRRAAVSVKNTQKLEPGVRFARFAKCQAISKIDIVPALQVAEHLYKGDETLGLMLKANIPMGTVGGTYWAGPLVPDEVSSVVADFADYLRPMTILGKFGANGIPALNRVGFRLPLVSQTSGGAGYWIGEGAAKKLTSFNFARDTLTPLKVANIAALSMEVIRDSNPSADIAVRNALATALAERLDIDFIDPDKSASSGISPASVTNASSPISSTGTDADAVRADITAIFTAFITANNTPTTGVWVMPARTALVLSQMRNALGQKEFPEITMMGGRLEGLPVIASEYVPADSDGDHIALINAQDVFLADDGGVEVSVSTEASLEMANDPSMEATTPTESTVVSMFQVNGVAFRAERTINWKNRRASGVQLLSGVNYSAAAA